MPPEKKNDLISLIVQQLQYYDMNSLAAVVAESSGLKLPPAGSNKLAEYVQAGMHALAATETSGQSHQVPPQDDQAHVLSDGRPGLEFVTGASGQQMASAQPLDFVTAYVTAHKDTCTSAAFNVDGRYVATGSADNSLKVLDVENIKAKSVNIDERRPMIRTFYDHTAPVNDIGFHPNSRVLASCSDDCTIKLYDLQRVGVKRGFRFLQDSSPIRSISFHPTGDCILAGTADSVFRIYDVNYLKCYSASSGKDTHELGINQIRYHHSGRFFVTAGEEGDLRVWDGVNAQSIMHIPKAHSGDQVFSASISNNGKYILSSGGDEVVKLWDLSSGTCLMRYKGASCRGKVSFNWNEEFVIGASDERNSPIIIWCARTGKVLNRLQGHTNTVGAVIASPTEDFFVSCSRDSRARFWCDERMLT